jgi:hypothetical protein
MLSPGHATRFASLAVLPALLAACGGDAAAARASSATVETPAAAAVTVRDSAAPLAVVYKSASCGCCKAWVAHMAEHGFRTEAHDTEAMDSVKQAAGVPAALRSCHTAHVGGYVIEGHVPAEAVQRLLREHPSDVAGLAVPGMVTGSPGMDGPYPEHYQVIAFGRDGATHVYEQH